MLHIALHFVVPLALALACYRPRWRGAFLLMTATLIVDIDHLLADPIYDPDRCSIGFHPLHTPVPIVLYMVVFVISVALLRRTDGRCAQGAARVVQVLALGLLIHMALDAIDCGF